MGLVVQKFGGTSVATEEARSALIKHVKKARDNGNSVVVVVSAMGRKGDPYATDTILDILYRLDPKVDPEKKDLLLSCGEIISCALISHYLDLNGIPSEALTGFQAGILTTNDFSNSQIININTTNIEKYLNAGKVVVIAGFQGITWDGKITTLGRGGSDTTAVELGGYLKADYVDIFTDVPGVAIVDPRIVPSPRYISRISYSDMHKLAYHGAKVIHPRAVKAAEKHGIQVHVRSTFTDDEGTLISSDSLKYENNIIGISVDREYVRLKLEKNYSDSLDSSIAEILFMREKSSHVDVYIKKSLEEDKLEKMCSKASLYEDDIACISVFIGPERSKDFEEEVKNSLKASLINILDIFCLEDRLAIFVDKKAIITCTQNIYSLS